MSKIKKKFIKLDTTTDGLNDSAVPSVLTPSNYTPVQVATEGTDKISAHLKGIDNALATGGKDVYEYASQAGFPVTGIVEKIYVDKSNNKMFRWTGSAYVELSPDTTTSLTASQVSNTPAGNIAATDVQAAINELDTEKQAVTSKLTSFVNNATTGVIVQNTATSVIARTITGSAPITVTNGNGVGGNPTIALSAITDTNVAVGANIAQSKIANLTTDLSNKQPLDPALTSLAALVTSGILAYDNSTESVAARQIVSTVSDITVTNGSMTGGNASLSLPDKVTAGSVGSSSQIPVLTYDSKGRITAVSSNAVTAGSTSFSPNGDIAATTVQTAIQEVRDDTDIKLSTKINSSEKGAANGVVPLNATSKIDSIYLPSFVDDVEEYSNLATFPVTGESGKIYVTLDTNKTYRWSGTVYTEISPSEVNSVFGRTGVVTAQSGDYNASQITNTPAGSIASITVQAAINELDAEKQPLDATLTALAALDTTGGMLAQTGTDTFAKRIITGSTGITVANGGGTTANPTISITNTGVTAGGYGSPTTVPTFNVNAQGQITSAVNQNISIPSSQITDFTEASQDAVGNALVDTASIDFTYNDATNQISATVIPAGVDHNSLANLTTGDVHTQYVAINGRAGGQTVSGGTASSENITVQSTTNATKGNIILSPQTTGSEKVLVKTATSTSSSSLEINSSSGEQLRLKYGNDSVRTSDIKVNANGDLVLEAGTTRPIRLNDVSTGSVTVGAVADSTAGKLVVNGIIKSDTGGFKFPDNTTQTTAVNTEVIQDAVGAALANTSNINLTYNDAGNQITADLTDTTVTAASYGSATQIPTITIDAKGRITGASNNTLTASNVANTPAGNIAATTVQNAINELDNEKLNKALYTTVNNPLNGSSYTFSDTTRDEWVIVTGEITGYSVLAADATTLYIGKKCTVVNKGNSIILLNFTAEAGMLLYPDHCFEARLIDNSNAGGTWEIDTYDKSSLKNVTQYDEFIGAATTFSLGFTASVATSGVNVSGTVTDDTFGVFQQQIVATAASRANLYLAAFQNRTGTGTIAQTKFNIPAYNLTGGRIRMGFSSDTAAVLATPTAGVYAQIDPTGWMSFYCVNASTVTSQLNQQAISAGVDYVLTIVMTPGSAKFYINGIYMTNITTNVPSATTSIRWNYGSIRDTAGTVTQVINYDYLKLYRRRA